MKMKFMRPDQFFLVSLIVNLSDESDVIGSHEPVKATVGQDVILPCHLDPPFDVSNLTVEWKQGAKLVHLYRSGADNLFGQDENYKDRTSLFHEEMTRGNISLKLTKVTEQDAGKYSCFVPNLHSEVRKDTVTLTVEQSGLICSHQPIVAQAGDDVILPCQLQPPINVRSQTVIWTRPGLDPEYIHYHEDGRLNSENQNPSYYYRTRLFMDELENGNVSMKIFRVKLSDTGEYKCSLPSMQKEASIRLTVDESGVIGSHEPVKATVGQDVILPCHLDPPSDVSTLTVEWKQGAKLVHRYRSGADDLHDQDKNYKNRTSLFHEEMTRGNISLKLTKVTEQDAGKYSCFVPNLHSEVRKDNVTLTVVHGEGETPARLRTGAVFGILLFVGVVVGIVVFAWKKRRKSEENAGDDWRRPEDDNQEGDDQELNYLRDNADNWS